jgi:hypothetical protein
LERKHYATKQTASDGRKQDGGHARQQITDFDVCADDDLDAGAGLI